MNLAGVVILYNPNENVIQNILTYLAGVSVLYVLDNSEEPNEKVVGIIKRMTKVVYISFCCNMGVSYALNYALRKCSDFDYLLTMDQDSKFPANEFVKYKKKIQKYQSRDIGIYTINYEKADYQYLHIQTDDYLESAITSGAIINVRIAYALGGFDDALFIDGVDTEYSYKVIKGGFKIFRFHDILMEHRIGAPKTRKFLFWDVYPSNHNATRRYYITRNNIYLFRKFHQGKRLLISVLFKEPIKILLYEDDKKKKIKAFWNGLCDGLTGKMGKCRWRL